MSNPASIRRFYAKALMGCRIIAITPAISGHVMSGKRRNEKSENDGTDSR